MLFVRVSLVWLSLSRRSGCGLYWLFESAAHKVAVHGVPFPAVFCRGETSRLVRVDFASGVGISCRRLPISWRVFLSSDTHSAWLILLGSSRRIHDVIQLAANKSSALCVACTILASHGSSSSSVSSCGTLSQEGMLSASWSLSSDSLGLAG